MNFNSLHFGAFFCVVFVLVATLRNRVRQRNWLLLIASYYFYSCWDWRFLGLIVVSTAVDFACGLHFDVRRIEPDNPPKRGRRDRLVLLASLTTNLGLLGFFKYYGFFVTSAADLLAGLGLAVHPRTLQIILPVGISFYTFQTLSYTIDLYRGRVTTERSLLNFAVYVAFFPQLVAGPIERASRLLPQVGEPRPLNWERLYSGFYLICWGLFKKVVVADNVALVADRVFGATDPSGIEVLAGVYAFAVQIYCDFSGYTDIARGAARCMGFDLMLNFNLPYFAVNPSDFWRRWHISLSTWLRDYLYVPLGGSRKGPRRTYINLMLTMVLGGLWHGAAWTFVAWGVYHGALLCLHRRLSPWLGHHMQPTGALAVRLWFWFRVVVFFHLTCLGWLLFRAQSLEQVAAMLRAVITNPAGSPNVLTMAQGITLLSCVGIFGVVQLVQWLARDLQFVLRLPVPARALVYAAGFLGFILFGNYGGHAFIYFQF